MGVEPQPEVILARLRPSARALFWPSLLLVAIAFGAGFGYGRLPEPWENTGLLALAGLLALICWVGPLLAWLSRNYTITSRRVVVRSGALSRLRQEAMLASS